MAINSWNTWVTHVNFDWVTQRQWNATFASMKIPKVILAEHIVITSLDLGVAWCTVESPLTRAKGGPQDNHPSWQHQWEHPANKDQAKFKSELLKNLNQPQVGPVPMASSGIEANAHVLQLHPCIWELVLNPPAGFVFFFSFVFSFFVEITQPLLASPRRPFRTPSPASAGHIISTIPAKAVQHGTNYYTVLLELYNTIMFVQKTKTKQKPILNFQLAAAFWIEIQKTGCPNRTCLNVWHRQAPEFCEIQNANVMHAG